ncbi:MAG: hypothetical protein WDN26_06740 [Chitinophagaceae bacterium]
MIPAIALTVLVGFGIMYWYRITGEAPKDARIIEVTGSQFKWEFRYPGERWGFRKKNILRKIDPATNNPLGQIWEDNANRDDIYVSGEPMHFGSEQTGAPW